MDGLFSLSVSHLDHELDRLYRNNGDGTFTDDTIASGIGQTNLLNSAFGARFFDFDNDGWRDLLVNNGHILDNISIYHPEVTYEEQKKLYRNTGKGVFVDVTQSQGADFLAPRIGRGLAVGDYDNDGWQDFLVSNNGEEAQLFRNEGASLPATKNNHWIAIQLVGTKSNRDAIGAQLKLVAGDLTSYDQTKGGMSYCFTQDPPFFFGLGTRQQIDSLETRCPSGLKKKILHPPVNSFLRVEEGKGSAQVLHNASGRRSPPMPDPAPRP